VYLFGQHVDLVLLVLNPAGATYVDILTDGSVKPGTTCVILDGIDFHP
jgi:hypothetical protein